MLIEPEINTFHPLTYEFEGTTFVIAAHGERAFVPRSLGLLLVREKLARIVDAEAEPAGRDYSQWVLPPWPTRH
jgi:hypothetical protein